MVTMTMLRAIRTLCNAEDLPAHEDMCVMTEAQARSYYTSGGVQVNRVAVLFMQQQENAIAGVGGSISGHGSVATTCRSSLPRIPQTTQIRKRTALGLKKSAEGAETPQEVWIAMLPNEILVRIIANLRIFDGAKFGSTCSVLRGGEPTLIEQAIPVRAAILGLPLDLLSLREAMLWVDCASRAGMDLPLERGTGKVALKPMVQPQIFGSIGGVDGELKPHQEEGLAWLTRLYDTRSNGILADATGLGKNVQIISLLAHLKERREVGPHLIVAPTVDEDGERGTEIFVDWVAALERWCPTLRVLVFMGDREERSALAKRHLEPSGRWWRDPPLPPTFDVCVTTADLVVHCADWITPLPWGLIVIDHPPVHSSDWINFRCDPTRWCDTVRRLSYTSMILCEGELGPINYRMALQLLQVLNPAMDMQADTLRLALEKTLPATLLTPLLQCAPLVATSCARACPLPSRHLSSPLVTSRPVNVQVRSPPLHAPPPAAASRWRCDQRSRQRDGDVPRRWARGRPRPRVVHPHAGRPPSQAALRVGIFL